MIDTIAPGRSGDLLLFGIAGIVLSALLVRRMIRLAVMDVPVDRSAHEQPTPRGGGVGMVAAVLAGVPVWLFLHAGCSPFLVPAGVLLGSVALLATVSWLDDLRQFPFAPKLFAQCTAAAGGVLSAAIGPNKGLEPALAGLLPFHDAWLAGPLVWLIGVCWLLLCTNAVNFMDGLNGLAAGACALCGVAMVPFGLATADPLLLAAGLMLAAGLLGFLPFNFPAARIFMGDVGSQVCGLLVGWFALALLADTGRPALALAVPLMLAGLLGDVLFTLGRRLLARERVTQAHRGHLYQVAARAGIGRATVALIEWGFVLWGLLASLLLPQRPVIAIAAVLVPLLLCGLTVRQRARRAGLGRWS